MLDERADIDPGGIFGDFVFVAYIPDNIFEAHRAGVFNKPPDRSACSVQSVVVECFYIQDHARAVVQRRENSWRRFLNLHH